VARRTSLQGSLPRSSLVLAGSFWPVSDSEGVDGDYFMVLSTDGKTPIIYGPKTNDTWVGVNQVAISTTPITYLQYLGDQANTGFVALPSNGTGSPGQICFLLDVNQACCAVAINQAGVWNILFSKFLTPTEILTAGGKPVLINIAVSPPPGPGPTGD
jgi:hypothetical protein